MNAGHGDATVTAPLRREHELIVRALALLQGLGGRPVEGEQADDCRRRWLLDFFSMFVDGCHHAKEEEHLFPLLERCGIPRDGGPLAVMCAEHDQGRRLLEALRAAEPMRRDIVHQYVALLRSHIDKENLVLFPLADRLLERAGRAELDAAFRAVDETVMGLGAYERLAAALEAMEGTSG